MQRVSFNLGCSLGFFGENFKISMFSLYLRLMISDFLNWDLDINFCESFLGGFSEWFRGFRGFGRYGIGFKDDQVVGLGIGEGRFGGLVGVSQGVFNFIFVFKI